MSEITINNMSRMKTQVFHILKHLSGYGSFGYAPWPHQTSRGSYQCTFEPNLLIRQPGRESANRFCISFEFYEIFGGSLVFESRASVEEFSPVSGETETRVFSISRQIPELLLEPSSNEMLAQEISTSLLRLGQGLPEPSKGLVIEGLGRRLADVRRGKGTNE